MTQEVQFDPHKSVPLTKFHEELWFEFQNLPTPLFDFYILKVARDMAECAPLIKRTLRVNIQPCVTRYYIDCPDGLELHEILDVRHVPTGNIECGSYKVPRYFAPPEHISCFSKGAWYTPEEQMLTLHLSNCAGYCRVVMSALPGHDACELPYEYYNEYKPVLVLGVRAQLLMITGRPWTNLRVGAELDREYRDMVRAHGVDKLRSRQAGIIKMNAGKVM